jgi:hypothetical protein
VANGGVIVSITKSGSEILALARPIHATSVRRYLLKRLAPGHATIILGMFEKVAQD